MERAASTLKRFGNKKIVSGYDASGKRIPAQTMEEDSEGVRMDDVWEIGRVPPIKQIFPTQKPDDLLKRIIEASSNEGDVLLDPFCGCGTAVVMADQLKRQWIGIDIAYEAMMIIEARLHAEHPRVERGKDYQVWGVPKDMTSAYALAKDDPYAFQAWAVSLLKGGQPHGRKDVKKGKDRGIDGLIYFQSGRNETGFATVSVKGGENIGSQMVRDLRGTMKREGAQLGIFLTLYPPTKDMKAEAAADDPVTIGNSLYAPIQIVTVEDLFDGKRPNLPPVFDLATLLTMPKAVPVMRKADPEKMRKQINMMLPIRGGKDNAKPSLFDESLLETATPAKLKKVTRRRARS
jgi:site-specific DNA-methyltransferase (adenine-specific)